MTTVPGLGGELPCSGSGVPGSARHCTYHLADGEEFNLFGMNTIGITVTQSASGQTCATNASFWGPLTVEDNLLITVIGANGRKSGDTRAASETVWLTTRRNPDPAIAPVGGQPPTTG